MPERLNSKYWSKSKAEKEPPHIKMGANSNIYLYDDGSIKATKFIDDDDRDISFAEFDARKDGIDGYYFEKPLDDSTSVQYIPANSKKIYKTVLSRTIKIKNVFAIIKGTIKKFILQNLDRHRHEDRLIQKEADGIIKAGGQYYYTEKVMGHHFNRRYIDSKNFGPYNYDTKIKVTKEISNIHDLLVIKTGNYAYSSLSNHGLIPSGETIVFASPHQMMLHTGSGDFVSTGIQWEYVYETGISWTGEFFTGTWKNEYSKKYSGLTNTAEHYNLSSQNIIIHKGNYLKTRLSYKYFPLGSMILHPPNSDPEYSEPVAVSKDSIDFVKEATNRATLDETYMALGCGATRTQGKRKHTLYEGDWDGTIPSGVPFKIETWSTNPKFIGYVGELSIVPVDDSIECDFEATCEAYGLDEQYESSILKAKKKAEQKGYRKLNNYLVNKGIKNKNSKMKKFDELITKNAQNVYEGLSYIRNETIEKQRGVQFSPLESLYYYDGTLEVYGGSKLNANYSYRDIASDLETTSVSLINPYTSQGGSTNTNSSATNTSNMGY